MVGFIAIGSICYFQDLESLKNLRNICDEIFGAVNFIATIVWQKIHSTKNDARYFSENHEYALVYAKSIEHFELYLLPRTEEMNNRYKNPDNDPRGSWQSGDLVASGERSNGHFILFLEKNLMFRKGNTGFIRKKTSVLL